MLNNILFKALLKISQENRENNYIYSDVYFPKMLMKEKTKKEKEKQLLYKNLYHLDKFYYSKKYKTNKIKDANEIMKNDNNKKQRNREDNFCLLKKLTLFSKTDLNTLSSLPKVKSQKNNNLHLNDLKDKYNIKNLNSTQFDSMRLTPKKQKSFQFDENITKKLNALKNNNLDPKGAINFHILNIDAPKEHFQKSISSISSNIFNLKNFGDTFFQRKFYKLIKLKAHNKKENKYKVKISMKMKKALKLKIN